MNPFYHDTEILKNLSRLGFQPKCIYDIGASNGCWSYECAPIYPHACYYLFEPLSANYTDLDSTLEHLKSHTGGAHLFNVAVGKENCQSSNFYLSTSAAGAVGSTSILTQETQNFETLKIPLYSLDQLRKEKALPHPDMIKMDIQGGELSALQGAEHALQNCTVLLLETWIARGYGATTPLFIEVVQWLAKQDFYIFDFAGQYRYGDASVLISQDVFFVRSQSTLGTRLNQEFHDRRF